MSENIMGSCLCGKVKYEIKNKFERFFLCHCAQCRKITGSAHASNLFGDPEGFNWTAGEKIVKRFDYPNRGFTNAFCGECGSGVPYLNQSSTAIVVPAGSLDTEPKFTSSSRIFHVERAEWDKLADTAEIFSSFPHE